MVIVLNRRYLCGLLLHLQNPEDSPKIIDKLLPALKRFFKRQPVELIFLFGSLAKDKMKPLSDVDIAVLFRNDKYNFKNISDIRYKLESLLGREDIDLAILNTGAPVICMQVIHTGKLLYARSDKIFKQFRFLTIQRYLATQYLRKSFFEQASRAILRKA